VNANRSSKSIVLLAVVVAASIALAETSKGSLELQQPTSIAGKQLASGSYKLQWEGAGEQVELKIYHGKNVVASTSAHLVKVDSPSNNDSSVITKNDDGSVSLSEIRFRGRKYALQITSEGGSAGAASGAAK
jgi:hypothetical protein